jgi:HD-like signal output (HDOD) protein
VRCMTALDRIVAHARALCPLPASAQRVLDITARDPIDLHALGVQVATDPALAAEVLAIANSARSAAVEPVCDLHRAVVRVGAREVESVAMASAMVAAFASRHERSGVIQARAALAGGIARELAPCVSMRPSTAYLAGLLSEIGALACLAVEGEVYGSLVELPLGERPARERELLGFTSPQVGAAITTSLRLGDALGEAIAADDDADASPLGRLVRFSRESAALLLAHGHLPGVEQLHEALHDDFVRLELRDGIGLAPEEVLPVLLSAAGATSRALAA